MPNVFTPNNDGQNDYFIIEGTPGVTYYIHVYNRWGQQVYSPPRSESIRWDGRDGSGQSPAAGVYLARIRSNGQERQLKLVRAE